MNRKNYYTIFTLLSIVFISFVLRLYGLFDKHPLWIDEYSAVDQALLIAQYGISAFSNPQLFLEHHNITTHILIALSFKTFGVSEWSARLPFAVIGSFIPVLIYFLGQKMFNKATALSASTLIVFSYFLITWSRQARGYVLLQLCILVVLYYYLKLVKEKKPNIVSLIIIGLFSLLGVLTHSFFYLLLISLFLHSVLLHKNMIVNALSPKTIFLGACVVVIFVITQSNIFSALLGLIAAGNLGFKNNLWYYHSFLWREYGIVTLLFIIGAVKAVLDKKTNTIVVIMYAIFHLLFITFLYGHYISKYLLPFFPIYMLFAAHGIYTITNTLFSTQKQHYVATSVFIFTIFLIANGHTFVNKPQKYYSPNHTFREIALVDYDTIYKPIQEAIHTPSENIAIIDTWPARTRWYTNLTYQPLYIFRWSGDDPNLFITGQKITRSEFVYDQKGNKIIPRNRNLMLIENVSDLKRAMSQYKKGFILIDDVTLPKEVIEFAEKNFKKEAFDDHYTFDDNPYSLWPTTLYSWGF